jgi:hypothetical protein
VAYFTVNSAWMNEETSEKISVRLAYLWFDILTFWSSSGSVGVEASLYAQWPENRSSIPWWCNIISSPQHSDRYDVHSASCPTCTVA